jgi:hypothetical protein
VADAALAGRPPQARDDVMGGEALGFVDEQNSGHVQWGNGAMGQCGSEAM